MYSRSGNELMRQAGRSKHRPAIQNTESHSQQNSLFLNGLLSVHVCALVWVSGLRYITERAPQLLPQVLYVPPLALVDGLSRQVDVVDRQLGLVKQPLHHEHRAWRGGRTPWQSDFEWHTGLCLNCLCRPYEEAQGDLSLTF